MVVSNRIAATIVAAALSLIMGVSAFNAARAACPTETAAPAVQTVSR